MLPKTTVALDENKEAIDTNLALRAGKNADDLLTVRVTKKCKFWIKFGSQWQEAEDATPGQEVLLDLKRNPEKILSETLVPVDGDRYISRRFIEPTYEFEWPWKKDVQSPQSKNIGSGRVATVKTAKVKNVNVNEVKIYKDKDVTLLPEYNRITFVNFSQPLYYYEGESNIVTFNCGNCDGKLKYGKIYEFEPFPIFHTNKKTTIKFS